EAPKRLRDLLWARVIVHTGPSFNQAELGECYMPVIYPFSYKHEDDNAKLGRVTLFQDEEGQEVPYGQKLFVVDGEDVSLLEIRKIEFDNPAQQPIAAAEAAGVQ